MSAIVLPPFPSPSKSATVFQAQERYPTVNGTVAYLYFFICISFMSTCYNRLDIARLSKDTFLLPCVTLIIVRYKFSLEAPPSIVHKWTGDALTYINKGIMFLYPAFL